MSKYPEYQHTKSRAWFDRALQVIPPGFTAIWGPPRACFSPPGEVAAPVLQGQGRPISGTWMGTPTWTSCAPMDPMSWATATRRGPGRHGAADDRKLHHRPLL